MLIRKHPLQIRTGFMGVESNVQLRIWEGRGGTNPAASTLVDSKTSPSGLIIATLKRAGEVKTGSF